MRSGLRLGGFAPKTPTTFIKVDEIFIRFALLFFCGLAVRLDISACRPL